jgi:hypothetical protein
MTLEQAASGHSEILARIGRAGARWRRRSALAGVLRVATIAVVAFVPYLVLDALRPLPAWLRIGWLGALLLFIVIGAILWIVRPLTRRVDPVRVAAEVERDHPELGEELEAAAELWAKRGTGRAGYSVELIDALIAKVIAATTGIDFGKSGRVEDLRAWGKRLGWTVAVAAVLLVVAGTRLGPAVGRLGRAFAVPETPVVGITVEPGDATIVAGEDLAITAVVNGRSSGTPVLRVEHDGELPGEREMPGAGEGAYRAVIGGVRANLRYSVALPEVESAWYDVRVMERPFVTGIRLEYAYPSYTGLLPRMVDENNGDVTALRGTSVRMVVSASKPLERAWLDFRGGERIDLARAGPKAFEGSLVVTEDASYSIGIVDADGLENPEPPTYSVVAVSDEYPVVKIVEPGTDREMPRDMLLPVAVSAIDDYGISALRMRYAIDGVGREGVFALEEPGVRGPREVETRAVWDLSDTGIVPGSVLVYFAEVVDNDRVSGPKTARSESYIVRFPTMAELYAETVGEQDDLITDLDELLESQEELKDEFEEIQEEIRSEPTLDWQEEERLEDALERQEEVAEDVVEMADRMSELSEQMSETDRMAFETLEKVDEITELLDEVATDEMRELIEEIRQAMREVSPDEISRAMEQIEFTQDDYLRRLEQTLNLLRRAKAEQTLADLANRAEDLAARQEALAQESQQSPSGERCESMAEEQRRIQEEAERLRADLERAIEEMEKVDQKAANEMRQAAAEADQSEMLEKMQQASSNFADQKPQDATASCQSAGSDLLTLFSRLSSCQGGMSCAITQRDREATLRAIDELLGVSGEQEEIVEAVEDRARIPRAEIVELVAKETDLVESMSSIADRMFQVSKDSYVIDPGIYRAFGITQMMMGRAAASIADGGMSAGRREAGQALGQVNRLIVTLLTSSQSQSASAGGSAMQQLMQQLQQMTQSQEQLNQMTEEIRQRMEELGMGDALNRQLAEARAQQERLLEDARRLAREFGDRREILGRLDDTVEDMEGTLAEMERSGASQETIDRQKRILSRLLDAQRSLRRRDYTRERRSRTGEAYAREAPGALPEDLTKATRELREDLLRAMQRDYPPEYRELIRAYFEGLSEDLAREGGREVPE